MVPTHTHTHTPWWVPTSPPSPKATSTPKAQSQAYTPIRVYFFKSEEWGTSLPPPIGPHQTLGSRCNPLKKGGGGGNTLSFLLLIANLLYTLGGCWLAQLATSPKLEWLPTSSCLSLKRLFFAFCWGVFFLWLALPCK